MIYPALVMKCIGYIDNQNKISEKPLKNSNLMRVLLDNGEIKNIEFKSNDSELNSLHDYMYNKSNLSLKSDKIKSAMSDLMFSSNENVINQINKEEENFKDQPNSKKLAIESLVKKMFINKNLIKSASIFRSAVAISKNDCNSKSIYVITDNSGIKQYSNSGIYSHAILLNQIPIELQNIRKKTGEHIGYMKITTSTLINSEQINYLLDHTIRTLKEKSFLPQFIIFNKMSNKFKQYAIEFNNIKKDKNNLTSERINRAIQILIEIKKLLNFYRGEYKFFKIELPILLPMEDFKNAISTVPDNKGKSPIQIFREALINVNFSKENPEVKKELKSHILNTYFKPMIEGRLDLKLLAVYNIVAPNIIGESTSWGFMHNNIDFSKLSLGKESIDMIYDSCAQIVDN